MEDLTLDITAAICTYNRYDLLPEAIESARRQTLPPGRYEIIVVDNTPDAARSREEAARFEELANFRWVHETRSGLSNARNVATRHARGAVLAFLDDDAVAEPAWLESLVEAYDAFGPELAVCGGPVRPRWGAPRPSWLGDEMLGPLSVVDLGPERRLVAEGEWLAGANISFRTEALRRFGGFDVALGRNGSGAALMSNEETELTNRIKAAGLLVGYEPRAAVEHWIDPARLNQAWFRRRAAWQAVSAYVLDPEARLAQRDQSWQAVKDYLLSRRPADRSLRALALEQESAGDFRWQVSAVYNAVSCLLAGLDERDDL